MRVRTWVLWVVFLLILIFTLVTYNLLASRLPHEVTIASGSPVGMYHQLALKLKEVMEAEHPRIKVNVRTTDGSTQNVQLLLDGEVDFALHQNGSETHRDLRNVANLYSEVLHTITRRDVQIDSIKDLRGKRVSVGAEGSGTLQMATTVLSHFGIGLTDLAARNFGFSETVSALEQGDLDAAFIVTGILSPALTDLLRTGQYRLLSIPEAPAFSFANPTIFAYPIPRAAYSGDPAVPAQDTLCLAVKASLNTRFGTPAYMVRTMTEAALSILFRKQMHLRELTETFAQDEQDFPLHRGALEYYRRGRPTFSSSVAEAFRDTLPYLLVLACLVIVIGATLRQRSIEARDLLRQRLSELMVQVSDVEEEQRGETDPRHLFRMLDQLSRIKKRAIEDHVHGRLNVGLEFVAFMMQLDGLINTIHGKITALADLETPVEDSEATGEHG